MKIFLLIVIIPAFLIACHKKNDNPVTTNAQTIFRFTINGKTDSITGSGDQSGTEGTIIQRVYYNASYYYNLTAIKNNTAGSDFLISVNFYTTALTTSTYMFQYTGNSDFTALISSGQAQTKEIDSPFLSAFYKSYQPGDETMISITKLQNNYADGIYTAVKLSIGSNCSTCPSSIQITNAEFKNVKIVD